MSRLGLAALVIAAAAAGAQPAPDAAALAAAARAGTARYQEQRHAARDGYRRIGGDAPAMGEHWVSVERLFAGAVRADAPAVLAYATIDGRPTLVGVAYAVAIARGAQPPPAPLGASWHVHAGRVDDEGLLLDHGTTAAGAAASGGVAVVHAWVWEDNPAGLLATENWALPWRRLGLAAPAGAPADAGRAIALAHAAGVAHFARLLRVGAALDSGETAATARALDAGGARVRALLAARPARTDATADDARALAVIWEDTWRAARAAVHPARRAAVDSLAARRDHPH